MPPSLANAQISLDVVAKAVMLAVPIRRARISVRATLTPVEPVLVKEFWNGEDALMASSRLPTVKSMVIIITKPSAAIHQQRLVLDQQSQTRTRIEEVAHRHSPWYDHRCIFYFFG